MCPNSAMTKSFANSLPQTAPLVKRMFVIGLTQPFACEQVFPPPAVQSLQICQPFDAGLPG